MNLHKNHRALAQAVADAHNLKIEFRDDAKKNDGAPNPNCYAVHIHTAQYDRDALIVAINDAVVRAWSAKQKRLEQ